MTSLVNKSGHWTPYYHKILIFSPPKSLKSLRAARIDELADSNEPAITSIVSNKMNPYWQLCLPCSVGRTETYPFRELLKHMHTSNQFSARKLI